MIGSRSASLRTAAHFLLSLSLVVAISTETQSESLSPLELKKLMDPSPIRFSVGRVLYQIPRNFLVGMTNWNGGQQGSVDIKLKYPGFLPFNKDTQACFLKAEPCRTIQFAILPEGAPSSKELFDDAAINSRASLSKGQDGYEYFSQGPETARAEYFRKPLEGRDFHCWCTSDTIVSDRKIYGSCSVSTRTRAGTIIRYRFSKNNIADADVIDTGLLDLVDSFVIGEN